MKSRESYIINLRKFYITNLMNFHNKIEDVLPYEIKGILFYKTFVFQANIPAVPDDNVIEHIDSQ